MTIAIEQRHPAPPRAISTRRLTAQVKWLLTMLDHPHHSLNILLVDDREMTWFNSHYRGKEGPTNVLSFPFAQELDPATRQLGLLELGDIIISLDTAAREAITYQESFTHRLAWLIIHGLLHLLGYDHERSSDEAEAMAAREQELLYTLAKRRNQRMTSLAINVDHIATIREARGGREPDPVSAAAICELAGAAGIVVHLREDRRHIQDRDVMLLRQTVKTKLNLEMGAAKEIIAIALEIEPDMVTLVPEKRAELTTEGGLDVIGQKKKLAKTVEAMHKKQIPVSIFVDPDPLQIKASHDIGATFVEIHTGRYCDAETEDRVDEEFLLIAEAVEAGLQYGLRVNAGHGLDYRNTQRIAALEGIEELSIGHAIISRAAFVGLDRAVREMLDLIRQAQLLF